MIKWLDTRLNPEYNTLIYKIVAKTSPTIIKTYIIVLDYKWINIQMDNNNNNNNNNDIINNTEIREYFSFMFF